MTRPIRIGLIAEGKTELGDSITDIDPQHGGKAIDRIKEGVLHTLIRRELNAVGFPDCEFIQRRPTTSEPGQLRTGHTIIQPDYLKRAVTTWKPGEIDIIILVVDADDVLEERDRKLKEAPKSFKTSSRS